MSSHQPTPTLQTAKAENRENKSPRRVSAKTNKIFNIHTETQKWLGDRQTKRVGGVLEALLEINSERLCLIYNVFIYVNVRQE